MTIGKKSSPQSDDSSLPERPVRPTKPSSQKQIPPKPLAQPNASKITAAMKNIVEKGVPNQPAASEAQSAVPQPATAPAPQKGVVQVRSLHIRKDHSTKSETVGGLVKGNEVLILETWSDGKNTWAKLGLDQWSAMLYDGQTYIKLV